MMRKPQHERGGQLFRLAATCPRCGTRPALRATEALMLAAARLEPDTCLLSYQCHRRGCGTIYTIDTTTVARAG